MTVRATNGYVYPASHQAGATAGALPMGARLRLKASKDLSAFPADAQKIFRAMQTYGLIVADNGTDLYVGGTYDTALEQLRAQPRVFRPRGDGLRSGRARIPGRRSAADRDGDSPSRIAHPDADPDSLGGSAIRDADLRRGRDRDAHTHSPAGRDRDSDTHRCAGRHRDADPDEQPERDRHRDAVRRREHSNPDPDPEAPAASPDDPGARAFLR